MFQARPPDSSEDPSPHPGLEPQVAGTAGTVLRGNHLPLAAGAQHIENTVEHRAVRYPWATVRARRLVGRKDGFDPVPQILGNLAESVPPFRFSWHRKSSMTERCLQRPSRPTNLRGFRTHS